MHNGLALDVRPHAKHQVLCLFDQHELFLESGVAFAASLRGFLGFLDFLFAHLRVLFHVV